MKKIITPFMLIVLLFSCTQGESESELIENSIRLNQIGYYPESFKRAVIVDETTRESFLLKNATDGSIVLEGKLSDPVVWDLSGETVQLADFSLLKTSGEYIISVEGHQDSYPFKIEEGVYADALKASVKGLYYQRASMALDEIFAGKWKRAMGHPDNEVIFHPSTGKEGCSTLREAGMMPEIMESM